MSKEPDSKQVMKTAIRRKESAISLENNEIYIEERRKFIDKFTLCDVVCKTYIENYTKTQKTKADSKKINRELDMRIIPIAIMCPPNEIPTETLSFSISSSNEYGVKISCILANTIKNNIPSI